ncbi:MAG TPA: hypothetical protein VFQ51_20230 [Vicinamibacteria bacterium]|nr:hypothetical protein [Vicinamibacteria bacterium]
MTEAGAPRAARAWPVALVALVPLWVVASAVSRGHGYLFFAAGALGLALAVIAFSRGRRDALYRYVYLLVLASAFALAFEAVLHLRPSVLRGRLANIAYTGYHWQRGGIYELDPHRGPVLRPGVRRPMYWNGHWWHHETGASGWRGPDVAHADAVFLGDSMIYGHGVEEPQTASARFAARTGTIAVNLGQQGTCQIQSFLTLSRHAARLRPRLVFASVHPTDVDEGPRLYPADELRRFADAPEDAAYVPVVQPDFRPRPQPWWELAAFWTRYIALPLRCAGLAGTLAHWNRPGSQSEEQYARDPFVPAPSELDAVLPALAPDAPPAVSLPWRAERRALREMKRLCDRTGARLVVFDLGYPRQFTQAVEALAREIGATYSDAGRQVLARCQAGERVYLADDGHWSPAGNDAIAERLAPYARQ